MPRKRRRVRKLRLAALLCVLLALSMLSFTFGLVRAVASEIPNLDPAAHRADINTVLYASNGRTVLAVLRGDENRVLLKTEDIAPIMRQAIVSVEDQRFYEHNGIDLRGVARALWADVRSQSIVEGGSTITQQFVKNAYIRNEQTLARKVREAALAWQLEKQWNSKDRILTAYLNTIYFGNGAYGIQQAARVYFRKSAKYLDLHEAALLAGLPADPSRYDPATSPRRAKERRRHVLSMMLDQGKIPQRDFDRADKAPLPDPEDIRLPGTGSRTPYFVNYVKDQLVDNYGAGNVFGNGLHVTTTIDLDLQAKGRVAIEKVLRNPDGPAAALVAIDPQTGAVKAMFGGRNFRESQFNLAAQAERQPGSAFKPLVLATAMREGISPLTEIESRKVSIDAGDRIWTVTNYDKTYLGRVRLDEAMVTSDNSVYAQLTDIVGPKAIVTTAHDLGIKSPLDAYFSIGLGSAAVNPLEMARAYATIANEGRRVDGAVLGDRPRVVERVEFTRGGRVEENVPHPKRVLDSGQAAVLTDILEDVVRSGTGKRANLAGQEHRGQDRHHRQLRGRVVRRLHAGARRRGLGRLPGRTASDAHGVRGRPGGRWDAACADLAGVHGEGDEGGRRGLRLPAVPRLHAVLGRQARRPLEPRQRLLSRRARARLLLGREPRPDGGLQAERGVGPARHRPDRGRRAGAALGAASRRRVRVRPRPARPPARRGRLPGSAGRRAVGGRRRAPLGHEGAPRAHSELRRLEPRGRGPGGAAAEARRTRHERAGADGHDSPAEPRPGRRHRARPPYQARGRGRLTKGEPLTE